MFFYWLNTVISIIAGLIFSLNHILMSVAQNTSTEVGALAVPVVIALLQGVLFFIVNWIALFFFFWLCIALTSLTIPLKKKYSKPSLFYRYVFNEAYGYLFLCAGARVRTTGLEKVPKNARFMFVSNHRSNFDNMIQSAYLKREPLAFISKPENFRIPMGRHFMVRGCYLSLHRDDIKQSLEVILKAIDLVKSGTVSMGVYPEGHRTTDGNLQDFKPGCFKIAQKANCPIVVSVIRGTEKIHNRFPFRTTPVNFDVIKVYSSEEISGRSTVELSNEIHSIMNEYIGNCLK